MNTEVYPSEGVDESSQNLDNKTGRRGANKRRDWPELRNNLRLAAARMCLSLSEA